MVKIKAHGQSCLKPNIIDKQGVMLTTGKDIHHAIQSKKTVSASIIKSTSDGTKLLATKKCIDLTNNTCIASITTSKVV